MTMSATSNALFCQAPLNRKARFALVTALAAGLLGGCAAGGPHPEKMVASAAAALKGGDSNKAISLAEQAVLVDPRNAAYRMLLGNAYLRSGRFESASQAYTEALDLGEDGGKAALSLALAKIAQNQNAEAIDTLNAYRDALPTSDYGLALALAGQPGQATTLLADALRAGDNTPKMRQNLAYAYALQGGWREAKVMASQDVPAGALDARLEQWAAMGKPEDSRKRVASMLGVPLRSDDGQPAALALANFPAVQQLAAEAGAKAEGAELAEAAVEALPAAPLPLEAQPALADASSTPVEAQRAAIDLPAAGPTFRTISVPVVQPYPIARAAIVAPARKLATKQRLLPVSAERGTHVAQLGSFFSAESAQRAWQNFTARNAALGGYRSQITQVIVNGHRFWRVQAVGFAGFSPAVTMCQSIKAHGGACLVMATTRAPAPSNRPVETRMARR